MRQFMSLLTFVVLLVGLNACSSPEATPTYHIAVIASGQSRVPKLDGLMDGLAERGYLEGENLIIALYNAENQGERIPILVEQAIASQPDLIVTLGGVETQAAKQAVSGLGIPIVFIGVADTVEWGIVDSFQRPGHQMTGVDNGYIEITSKRLEYLTMLLPEVQRVILLYSSDIVPSLAARREAELAASCLGLELEAHAVNSVEELQAFASLLRAGDADAIVVTPSFTLENALSTLLLPAATEAQIPVVGLNQDIVAEGALMAYGASFQAMGYQAARLVSKVLRGVPAGEIPVEFPEVPKFSVNLSTESRLGVTLSIPVMG